MNDWKKLDDYPELKAQWEDNLNTHILLSSGSADIDPDIKLDGHLFRECEDKDGSYEIKLEKD